MRFFSFFIFQHINNQIIIGKMFLKCYATNGFIGQKLILLSIIPLEIRYW